jgi:hypothetical protein
MATLRRVHDKTLILGLSVALLLAVGLFVGTVGRAVYGIARYYLRERKPKPKFRHSELGVFTSDGHLWTCEILRDGRELHFVIGGTEDAPSQLLLTQAQSLLGRFAAVEQRAIEFLRNRESEVRDAALDFYLLDLTDEKRPDDFTFEFVEPGDASRIWRVEFVGGEPKETGFDD